MAKDFYGYRPVKRLPKCFMAAYDLGDIYADRYHVIFAVDTHSDEGYARAMSDNAMQPNGVNMMVEDIDNIDYEIGAMDEIAKRMKYSKLPNQVQRAIKMECEELGVDYKGDDEAMVIDPYFIDEDD